MTVSDGAGAQAVHVIRMPALANDAIVLPSEPLAAGIIAETKKGFVAQRHPEGRITFVDLGTGSPRTVTGFELADEVDYGSNWRSAFASLAVALGLLRVVRMPRAMRGGAGYDGAVGSSANGTGGSGTARLFGRTRQRRHHGGLPPEQEIESAYRAPVVTGRYVWSANPESGRVAVIDPNWSRSPRQGSPPLELAAALPERDGVDRVIVMNSGGGDAMLLRADEVGARDHRAGCRCTRVRTPGPSRRAGAGPLAWTEASRLEESRSRARLPGSHADGPREQGRSELSVGFRPSRVVFSDDERRAFVVTEPGLSVIELDEALRVSSLVELTEDPLVDPGSRDVNVCPTERSPS